MCTGAEIALVAGGIQGAGSIYGGIQQQREAKKLNKQTAETAKATLRQTAGQQAQRLGSMRTAYAKAGVTQTGTAQMTLDEQQFQDEMTLNAISDTATRLIKKTAQQGRDAFINGLIGGAGQIGGSAISAFGGGTSGGNQVLKKPVAPIGGSYG